MGIVFSSTCNTVTNRFLFNFPGISFVLVPPLNSYFPDTKSHVFIFSVIYGRTQYTLDRSAVGWRFVPRVIALHGSVPNTSFFSPKLQPWWIWGTPGPKEALLWSLMRLLIKLMRQLWMRLACFSVPFVLWFVHTIICSLSETEEVKLFQNIVAFYCHSNDQSV